MQVSRWGNSLAIRLPAAVVETLRLAEGDEITIEVASPKRFLVARDQRRADALETLRELGWVLPDDITLSREDANARGG
jgi:antitoxin MazE